MRKLSNSFKTEQQYIQVVKDELGKLDDPLLIEDVDLLCQYVVLRFLKTSPRVHEGLSMENVVNKLQEFVKSIYPFLVTFITVVNSSPLTEVRGKRA